MKHEALFRIEANQFVTFDELIWYWHDKISSGDMPCSDDRQRIGDSLEWNDSDIVSTYFGRDGEFWKQPRRDILDALLDLSTTFEDLHASKRLEVYDGVNVLTYSLNDCTWHVHLGEYGVWTVVNSNETFSSSDLKEIELWIWRRGT